jgi:hypothetical protein
MRNPAGQVLLSAILAGGCLAFTAGDAGGEEKAPVASLLEEAAKLAEAARAGYAKAHGMAPCPERNEVLSQVHAHGKAALERYQRILEADPKQGKALETRVSELTSMLLWCDRNRVAVGPPEPSVASPPPGPDAPTPLTQQEQAHLSGLCKGLSEAFGQAKDGRDQVAGYQDRIQEISGQLDAVRLDMEANPMNWPTIKTGETRRESLMDKIRQNRKLIQSKLREIQSWEEKIRVSESQVDAYGIHAFPFLAGWMGQRKDSPSPEMADYLGRQLAKRQFSFTPVPAGARFPAESEIPPARVQETQELLDLLLKSTAQVEDLALSLADTEAKRSRVAQALSELEAHWAWRQKNTAWSPKEIPALEDRKDGLRRELAVLVKDRQCATEGQREARKTLEALKARLGSLDPSQARVLEGWRRARKCMPSELETLLEAWVRRTLKN